MSFDRKTYYTQKYGPDYFKKIGRKGGRNGPPEAKRRAGIIGGNSLARRVFATDPGYYQRILPKDRPINEHPFGGDFVTCSACMKRHLFRDKIAAFRLCPCGADIWYFPRI